MRLILLAMLAALFAPQPLEARERERTAKEVFRDCRDCPEMVAIPGGEYMMNSGGAEHMVRTRVADFAIGRTEVAFDQWALCVRGGGCTTNPNPDDSGWGRGQRPVINISYGEALEYVAWLSRETRQRYRLPTDAEWEYAAQTPAGVPIFYDNQLVAGQLSRAPTSGADTVPPLGTAPVGAFAPNWFGLQDVLGNVSEWVADDPATARPGTHFLRGAFWGHTYWDAVSLPGDGAYDHIDPRSNRTGFRVARDLSGVRNPEQIRMRYTGAEAPPMVNGVHVITAPYFAFEGETWRPTRATPLYAAAGSTQVVATAAAGEALKRAQMHVLLRPLRGVVVQAIGPFEEGAVAWLMEPESEGNYQVWYRGEKETMSYPPGDARFRWESSDAYDESVRRGCWTRLTRADGTGGWSNDPGLGCDWVEPEMTSDDE
jgi:formylglycine-generating enzyme required for sulfatase activity